MNTRKIAPHGPASSFLVYVVIGGAIGILLAAIIAPFMTELGPLFLSDLLKWLSPDLWTWSRAYIEWAASLLGVTDPWQDSFVGALRRLTFFVAPLMILAFPAVVLELWCTHSAPAGNDKRGTQ